MTYRFLPVLLPVKPQTGLNKEQIQAGLLQSSHLSRSPGSGCKPRLGLGGRWRFGGLSGELLNTRLWLREPTLSRISKTEGQCVGSLMSADAKTD